MRGEGGPITDHDDYIFQRDLFGYRVDAWLRREGWKHTSSSPGSYWVWAREVDGQSFAVGRDLAVSMQASLDGRDCICDEHSYPSPECCVHGKRVGDNVPDLLELAREVSKGGALREVRLARMVLELLEGK